MEAEGVQLFYIMLFTNKEKSAIVRVAVEMQGADGKDDVKEYLLNAAVFQKFHIGNAEIDNAKCISLLEALSTIASMATEEKDFISAFLGSLIVVDDHIDDKEMTLWKFISTICGFPTMNIQTAIERFQQYMAK